MDLKQLQALIAVAEHGSFSAAARAIHTVQSNISTHIARLETELGALLVIRSTGQLTDEGRIALSRARRVTLELESMSADVAASIDHVSGTVRIGVIGSVARWFVPPLLRRLREQHPDIQIIIVDASTTSLTPQLIEGTLDLAIVNLPMTDPDLEGQILFEEERVLVVPVGHVLADRQSVVVADLRDHPLVLEPKGTTFRDELDEAAALTNTELQAIAEVDGMMLVAFLAVQGLGPAVLPASAIQALAGIGDWRVVRVDDLPDRDVGLAKRRKTRLAAPARAVWDLVVDEVLTAGVQQRGVALAAHVNAPTNADPIDA